MKKFILYILLLMVSISNAQTLLQGFESGGSLGATFGGFPTPVIETGTGANTSQVLKLVTNPTQEVWQGVNLFLSTPVNLTVNKTMTIDVLAFEPMTFLVKVTTGGATAAAPVTHNGNGIWQTLSFTFNTALDGQSANPSGTYSGFVIHPYWGVGQTSFATAKPPRTFYVDNISDPTIVLPPITGNVYINDNSLTGDIWCSAVGQPLGTATGTTSLPYRNLTELFADRVISPGAIIHVDSGTYSGRIVFSDSEDGTVGNVITIKGAGTGLTSLTSSLSTGSLISMGGADFMTFQDMTITGGNEENAILVAGTSTNCTFNNLNITGNNKGIRVEGGSNFATISNNKINGDNVGATDYGIFITNGASNGHSIFNNMVSNFAHTFRSDNTGTINCNLYHNSFFANQFGSVAYLTGWNVKNNIFYTTSNDASHVAFWYGDSTSPTTLDNNLYFHPNAARAFTRFGPNLTYASLADFVAATPYEDNGVEGNPLFLNAAVGNLHIQPGSLAIGAGVDVGITVDIDGDARPLSGTFDIGADEFDASTFVVAPTITDFTVPAQLTGAVFELTAPTSNSSGAFSYTSSNLAVATVSGNTVTVIGTGSTVITANQAAVPGEFTAGSITATLNVTLGAAPTQPPRLSSDVISVFAGAYANVAGTNFNPNWGQSGFGSYTQPSYGGDQVLQYANLNYQGTETAANVNATDINTLHINIYSTTLTSIRLSVISFGPTVEKPIVLTLVPNQWNSFNIDLTSSTFNGLNRAQIRQFKYDQPSTNGQTLIVDNIYFWREAGAAPSPTITAFSVPAQLLGAEPFELIPPTSNSSGAFSYASGNTAVATVSGSTVTVVGVGTSIITATQEAVPGEYLAGSTTANFVVTPVPAPTPPNRNAANVISFYSDSYGLSSTPTWAGTSNSDIQIEGNNTRLFTGFTNGRIDFAPTNVSQMTHVHVDVFSVNLLSMWFFLGSEEATKMITLNTPVNGWTTLDIPLSDFTSSPTGGTIDLNAINLFRFENPEGAVAPSRTIYIANIYFYRNDTWTGSTDTNWSTTTNWSSGSVPTESSDVIIPATSNQPIIAENVTISSLTIIDGATLLVMSGNNLTASTTVKNSGTLTLQNNANLLQSSSAISNNNSGNIVVKRNSSLLLRLDHTLWSSPVTGQNLFSFSPQTLTNRFYTYNTSSNGYVSTGLDANTIFAPGNGYAIRAPNNHPAAVPTLWEGSYVGVPNNGTIPYTLSNAGSGFNLIGNPYPSPIDAAQFITENSSIIGGTLYFYAHSLTMNADGSFPAGTNYSTWNSAASTVATTAAAGDPHPIPVMPNGIIQVGQGFIVKATNSGVINFKNTMRIGNNADQFLRSFETEKSRVWLNLTTESGTDINQIAVAYLEGATDGVDNDYDGLALGNSGSYLSTKIDNDHYVIQSRGLPFDVNDEVDLGFRATFAGNYKIILSDKDGLFSGDQDIFIRDNLLGIEHNIKISPYLFSSQIGMFDERFQLVFSQVLNATEVSFNPSSVIVFKAPEGLKVVTNNVVIKDIYVYDISGRLILKKENINESSSVIAGLPLAHNVFLLKIISREDNIVTTKVIN